MPNTPITREDVHKYAEACSDMGMDFQSIASRLLKEQNRLKTFIESNFKEIDPLAGQVALYMLSVSLRVFEQDGGRMKKINSADLNAAQAKINGAIESLLPLDESFPSRAKTIEWRAQENLLDEILWALFERDDEEKKEEEQPMDSKQSAMIYLMLWATIEAMNSKYRS